MPVLPILYSASSIISKSFSTFPISCLFWSTVKQYFEKPWQSRIPSIIKQTTWLFQNISACTKLPYSEPIGQSIPLWTNNTFPFSLTEVFPNPLPQDTFKWKWKGLDCGLFCFQSQWVPVKWWPSHIWFNKDGIIIGLRTIMKSALYWPRALSVQPTEQVLF